MTRLAWIVFNFIQWTVMWSWNGVWITLALLLFAVTGSQDLMLKLARVAWAPGIFALAGARLSLSPHSAEIEWNNPHVFVMNHQSSIDIPVAFAALPVPLRFVAKKAFLYFPFFGAFMWAAGMVFVDRGRSAKAIASMKTAGRRIRDGANIIAFPEGTRSRDGQLLPFKKGIFVVALEAGVPIVPVAAVGTGQVMVPDNLAIRPGAIRVRVGAPIETAGVSYEDRDELIARVRRELGDLIAALSQERETELPRVA